MHIRIAPLVIAVGLLVAACGAGDTGRQSAANGVPGAAGAQPPATDVPATDVPATDVPATDPALPGDAPPAVAVPAALQFSAPVVGGGEIDLTTLAGKPTVFWFWAPT